MFFKKNVQKTNLQLDTWRFQVPYSYCPLSNSASAAKSRGPTHRKAFFFFFFSKKKKKKKKKQGKRETALTSRVNLVRSRLIVNKSVVQIIFTEIIDNRVSRSL
jgi:hypothetical protein